jgi:hypothetical protein
MRPAPARSVHDRRVVSEFDKCEIGRDGFPPHHHEGAVATARAWLACYAVGVIFHFMAFGN